MDRAIATEVTEQISRVGREAKESVSPSLPAVREIRPENPEVLTRYLYLMAVLDQGPDPEGVRMLLNRVLERLYAQGVPILNEPRLFFEEIHTVTNVITDEHELVKKHRASAWAANNNTNPEKYSLFFYQSRFGMQRTDYIGFYLMSRWGTPLFYISRLVEEGTSLRRYVEGFNSCEIMTKNLKSHPEYGLGKAIGDKAAHLFGKWYVHTFDLRTASASRSAGWSPFSYEVPFDSNAGRVLFRTGWLLVWAELDDYATWNVIQKDQGKNNTDYIRVTNIRGKGAKQNVDDSGFRAYYGEVLTEHLQTKGKRWRKVEIQQIPNALLLETDYTLGEFDDGLMAIGTSQCFNHGSPDCEACPIQSECLGNQSYGSLIQNYRT